MDEETNGSSTVRETAGQASSAHAEGAKTFSLSILLVTAIIALLVGAIAGTVLLNPMQPTQGEVAAKLKTYLNNNAEVFFGPGISVDTRIKSSDGSFYVAEIDIIEAGEVAATIETYITKDGVFLLSGAPLNMNEPLPGTETPEQPDAGTDTVEVQKSAVPEVDLFVMSHCPFGTQVEKGIIPVAELLGDKINFNIRFVYYAMHGATEVNEQLNQYCIQKGQNELYLPYLKCFLDAGDSETCLAQAGIDTAALAICTAAADTEFSVSANLADTTSYLSGNYPLFNIDKALNELYGVGGSPTLVVNGTTVSIPNAGARSPANLLSIICEAFNESPEDCAATLSSEGPSSGFGYADGVSSGAGACGA